MNIVEHDDNIVVKEKSNVQQYLMRVIQRYFDNECIETESSIEAIIVEALIRMKREILHERSFVFTINDKAGHVKLNITDLNGEPVFNKKTAFNKDFCLNNISTADTICKGNDTRLANNRIPLPHNHQQYKDFVNAKEFEYKDFTGTIIKVLSGRSLEDILSQITISSNISTHVHYNFDSIIKRLVYSGAKTEIDLQYFEILHQTLIARLDDAKGLKDTFDRRSEQELQGFTEAKEKSKRYYEYSKSLAKIPPTWYDNAIEYTDGKVTSIEDFCNDLIDKGVTQEEFTEFQNNFKKYLHIVAQEDNIPIGKDFVEIHDKVMVTKKIIPITIPANSGTIQKIDAYLSYDISVAEKDENGVLIPTSKTITVPIPYICKEQDGSYTYIHCVWNKDNGYIEISTRTTCLLPMTYIYNNESVIQISPDVDTYYNSFNYAMRKNSQLCIINSQDKLNYIKTLIGNGKYFINGFKSNNPDGMGDSGETPWCYSLINGASPITFLNWAPGEPNTTSEISYIYIQNDGYMRAISVNDTIKMNAIYEFTPPTLEINYDNPRISYKVYAGGE